MAIVGIGTVMLNGIYGAETKKRPGPGGLAIAQANYRVSMVAENFIYAGEGGNDNLTYQSPANGNAAAQTGRGHFVAVAKAGTASPAAPKNVAQ